MYFNDELKEMEEEKKKEIKTFDELYKEVKKLYPEIIKMNDLTTIFNDGFRIESLFGCIYWEYAKIYAFYYFKTSKKYFKKFPKINKKNETKDPNKILNLIKDLRELEEEK
jgi:hypothetical protein